MDLTKNLTCLAEMIDYMLDTCYLYLQNLNFCSVPTAVDLHHVRLVTK